MNINQIRENTKYCKDKLFFDSAGASLMPKIVVNTMINYLKKEEEFGGYSTASLLTSEIKEFYTATAKLINSKPENIAFTYNATDSFVRALSSIPFEKNDYIITTNDDYISNQIAFLSLHKKLGIKIVRSNNLPNGDLDLDHFETLIKKHNPKLIAVTHIPTSSGLIQQVEKVGKLCKKYNIWYLLDACQSVGQIQVDVQKIGCDFMSVTGRKFLRGPRGTGFLYVSDKVIEKKLEPFTIDMRGADWIDFNTYKLKMSAKRFETWEFNYASVLGLKEAIKYANNIGIKNIEDYNKTLSEALRKKLSALDNVHVLDRGSKLANIITFNIDDVTLFQVEETLKNNNVFYSVSRRTSALIDFTNRNIDWAIRLSPHYFNTLEEIDAVCKIVEKIKN